VYRELLVAIPIYHEEKRSLIP
jgi:hypothetical protein